MTQFGTYRASHPLWGEVGYRLSWPLIRAVAARKNIYPLHSAYAQERLSTLQAKLKRGEPVYLLGIGPGGHNAGASLVRVTREAGVELICNNEEERFTGLKHYADYPSLSVENLLCQLESLNLKPTDLHACLANWDYIELVAHSVRLFWEEFPGTLRLLKPQPRETFLTDHQVIFEALNASQRLEDQLEHPCPLINLRHHDNHAYFSLAVSPFARLESPVMVAVIDGSGDDGSVSLYLAEKGKLRLVYNNRSMFDSLGTLYTFLSATQGGWTPLSSEGRYMGAAAWGNGSRLTNPYYHRLRHLIYFGPEGRFYLNRSLANWHRAGYAKPYTAALIDILGPPILPSEMWQPDKVLNVDNIEEAPTQERLDKAAATQLLFEDVLFHVIGQFIRRTGSQYLIFSGGTALNCVANMRLLNHFNEAYYDRYLQQRDKRLHLWVPPIPGDAGTPAGAAYHFALKGGASPGPSLQHAFYCGTAFRREEFLTALQAENEIGYVTIARDRVAELLAFLVAHDEVVGLFQGVAETGPRALGHRSILANPCRPDMLQLINRRVKYREPFRPLAPMVTPAAARRWFYLSAGAAADDYNAYNYMVLTVLARPEARKMIPAVIHKDGTARIQIVRRESDPLSYAYLEALGRRIGVEVSVNSSLNVGSPIVQTPAQALETLKRAKALTALMLFDENSEESFLAWHAIRQPPKDGGQRLRKLLQLFRA